MAKKSKNVQKTSQKNEKKSQKRPQRRWWKLKLFILVIVGIIGYLALFPEAAVRYVLRGGLEAMGLTPAEFTITHVGFSQIVLTDIKLGTKSESDNSGLSSEPDLSIEKVSAAYTLSGLWRGHIEAVSLASPTLNGDMYGGANETLSFGVLDPWLLESGGGAAADPALPATTLSIKDGLIKLHDRGEPVIEGRLELERVKDAASFPLTMALTLVEPKSKEAFGRVSFSHDGKSGLELKAALDVPDLVLFEWGLEGAHLAINFQSMDEKGAGTAQVGIEALSLDPEWLSQSLAWLPLNITATPGARPLKTLLIDGLRQSTVTGKIAIAQEADDYHLTFLEPLQVRALSEEAPLRFQIDNAAPKEPAFTYAPKDKHYVTSNMDIALLSGEEASPSFQSNSFIKASTRFGESTRRIILEQAELRTSPLYGEGISLGFSPLQLKGTLLPETMDVAVGGALNVNGALLESVSLHDALVALDGRVKLEAGQSLSLEADLISEETKLSVFETVFSGDTPNIKIDGAYALNDEAWSVDFETSEGALLMETGLARLSDIVVKGTATGKAITLLDLDAVIEEARVTNPETLALFAPLNVRGEVISEEGLAALSGSVFQRDASGDELQVLAATGSHHWARGEGSLALDSGDIRFDPSAAQPERLMPSLEGVMVDVTGLSSFKGSFKWATGGDVVSGGQLTLADINFASAVGPVNGVNAQIEFSNLLPLTTARPQTIDIQMIDVGLELAFGFVKVRFLSDGRILLEDALWPWAGGELGLEPAELVFGDEPQALSLFARNVDLQEVFTLLDVDGLSGDGRMQGNIPVVLEKGGATISDGKLSSLEPGGTIQYVGAASAAAETSEGSTLLFDALENFSYDTLEVTINGQTTDLLKVDIVLKGRNEALLGGYPINLNVTTEGPLTEMIRKGTAGYRLPATIRQNLE